MSTVKHRLVLTLLALVLSRSAGAMDCTLSRADTDPTWKASCGLQRAGPRWTGLIQGPLAGSRLLFSATQKRKSIEGGILSPLSMLSEIPFCNIAASAENETCKIISKKISLPVPFELISYGQDPIAFTIGSQWDAGRNSILRGTELVIAACGTGPAKNPDETSPLLYFRKTMDCKWNDHPMQPSAPDRNVTLAVNCQAPATSGILTVNTGNIRCEVRQKSPQAKPFLTDSIPVICIPPQGKSGSTEPIDPITCLADNRIGFTTQTELREKIKTPGSRKNAPASKSSAGSNGI